MTDEQTKAGAVLPPIEHDADYDRYYIPMPGGWEVQTKGKGSTFRIANSITGERFAIFEQPFLFENLERMAREIHAAASTPQPPPEAGSVEQRERVMCEAIINNQFQDTHRSGRLTIDVEAFLREYNARKDAAPAPKETP